jgi:hypothetical protein
VLKSFWEIQTLVYEDFRIVTRQHFGRRRWRLPMGLYRVREGLNLIAWLFPLAVMGLGALFAPLRTDIRSALPAVHVSTVLLLQVILLGGWLLAEFWYAASRETTIRGLQTDAFRSLLLALFLTFGAGWLLAANNFPWFYAAPAIAAIMNAFLTANQGLNNAAQKPFLPPRE